LKLLVDMNLSPRWVDVLAAAGFEAAHWSKVGLATATDLEILDYAQENDYVVLTHDLDFGAILAAHQGLKPSVVQIRARDINPGIIGAQIVAGLRQTAHELDAGALVTIDMNRTRVRILPLGSVTR
jgi:predicted nuclease of predicted toxin-antitoxin system